MNMDDFAGRMREHERYQGQRLLPGAWTGAAPRTRMSCCTRGSDLNELPVWQRRADALRDIALYVL